MLMTHQLVINITTEQEKDNLFSMGIIKE